MALKDTFKENTKLVLTHRQICAVLTEYYAMLCADGVAVTDVSQTSGGLTHITFGKKV